MKLTITNDEGEVFAILTEVHVPEVGHATGVDEEGEVTTVSSVLSEAKSWERANGWDRPAGHGDDTPRCSTCGRRDHKPGTFDGHRFSYSTNAKLDRQCRVTDCTGERFDNWSTCEAHEARGSRVFDR